MYVNQQYYILLRMSIKIIIRGSLLLRSNSRSMQLTLQTNSPDNKTINNTQKDQLQLLNLFNLHYIRVSLTADRALGEIFSNLFPTVYPLKSFRVPLVVCVPHIGKRCSITIFSKKVFCTDILNSRILLDSPT